LNQHTLAEILLNNLVWVTGREVIDPSSVIDTKDEVGYPCTEGIRMRPSNKLSNTDIRTAK
jgi:hypothetical protein